MLIVEIHAQTAATHHAVPIGACASAPDVRQGKELRELRVDTKDFASYYTLYWAHKPHDPDAEKSSSSGSCAACGVPLFLSKPAFLRINVVKV